MDKWCAELGFKPADDVFFQQFQQKRTSKMKMAWNHIFKNVRPKYEADVIKKQCLLYTLRTSNHFHKIEVAVASSKDYISYLKTKKDQGNLNTLKCEINKKIESINQYLSILETSRQKYLKEDSELIEKVNKLQLLKKKKITISRLIEKLNHDCSVLNILISEPNKVVQFGSDPNDWIHQVTRIVKELPYGFEYQSVVFKLHNLLQESKFDPVPFWDRLELMSSMEKKLSSMNEKLKEHQSALDEEEVKIKDMKTFIVSQGAQILYDVDENGILVSLDECKEILLNIAEDACRKLCAAKAPHILDIERNNIRRIERLISAKYNDITSLLPIESEEITNEYVLVNSKLVPEPHILKLPFEKLRDSLSKEVSLFMKTPFRNPDGRNISFQNIEAGYSTKSLHLRLTNDCEKLTKLLSFVECLSNLVIPPLGVLEITEFKDKILTSQSNISQAIENCEGLLLKVSEMYNRLKTAFDFWRKEPLNKRLTGIEVLGNDVSYWLSSYCEVKGYLDHEEWIQGEKLKEKLQVEGNNSYESEENELFS